jgi:uncharacterized protein YceK
MKSSIMSLILLFVAAAVLLWGCATIMHGTSQRVGISSAPTGARVSVDNVTFGNTPLFANLARGDDHIVTIELDGYQNAQFTLTKDVSGWVWGNIVFGGLIGLVVDAASGGLYDLSPEQLHAELKKENVGVLQQGEGLYLITVLHADPSWHKIMDLKSQN